MVRRRHRTWVLSMCLATLGWGTWWVALVLKLWAPAYAPTLFWTGLVSSVFALPGFLIALFSLRARRTWILFVLVPLFANGSMLALPSVVKALELKLPARVEEPEEG